MLVNLQMVQRFRSSRCRKGTATTELAVCLPVLVAVVFGSIEATNAIYLKQAATAAAYEGARIATSAGGTLQATTTRIEEVLAAHALTAENIDISPALAPSLSRGTPVFVSVSVPAAQTPVSVTGLFGSDSLGATISMIRQ